MDRPIKPTVERTGQPYRDQPVHEVLSPRQEFISRMALSVHVAYMPESGEPIHPVLGVRREQGALLAGAKPPRAIRKLVGYKRIPLRWMKPGPEGGLVPRYPNREPAET